MYVPGIVYVVYSWTLVLSSQLRQVAPKSETIPEMAAAVLQDIPFGAPKLLGKQTTHVQSTVHVRTPVLPIKFQDHGILIALQLQ